MIQLDVPYMPINVGDQTTFRVKLAIETGVSLGALALRVHLSRPFFDDVEATALAFDGAQDALSLQVTDGESWLIALAGASLSLPPGPVDLLDVTCRLTGPVGRGVPIAVQVVDAATRDGLPMPVEDRTVYLFSQHGPVTITTEMLHPGYATAPYQAVLRAQGGFSPHSWSLESGALPAGMELSPSGVLTGIPDTPGEVAFTLRVADSTKPVAQETAASFTLKIREAPLMITSGSLALCAPGQPYTALLEHTGGRDPISWEAHGLPPGLAVVGNRVQGDMPADHYQMGLYAVELSARDAADPVQEARRTVSLPVVPRLPDHTFDVPNVTQVALGRDLVMVTYDVQASGYTLSPERDAHFEGLIDEAKDWILGQFMAPSGEDAALDRLIDVAYGDRAPEGGLQPWDEVGWVEADLTPEPDGDPWPGPDGGPGGAYRDEAERLWQLWQLYTDLDDMQHGMPPAYAEIDVLIDDIQTLSFTVGQPFVSKKRKFAPMPVHRPPGRIANWLMRMSAFMTGGRTMRFAREALDESLRQRAVARSDAQAPQPELRSSIPRPQPKDQGSTPARGSEYKGKPDVPGKIRQRSVKERENAALAATSRLRGDAGRLYRHLWVSPLVLIGALLVASFAGGAWALALTATSAAAVILAGLGMTRSRWNEISIAIWDLIDRGGEGGSPKPPGNVSERVPVVMTPGAHRVTVRWSGSVTSGSAYGSHLAYQTLLHYKVTIAPRNPSHWSRLAGPALSLKGHGNIVSATRHHPISAPGTDVDMLVTTDQPQVSELFAARGDGSYAAPAAFPEKWPSYHRDPPPIVEFISTCQVDEYGRTSVVEFRQGQLPRLFKNQIGGYSGRNPDCDYAIIATGRVLAVEAADFDGDGWKQLVVAHEQQLVTIGSIKPEPIDNRMYAPLTCELLEPGIGVGGEAGLAGIHVTPKLSAAPATLPDESALKHARFDHIALAYHYESVIRLIATDGTAHPLSVQDLVSLDIPGPLAQPAGVYLHQAEGQAPQLLLLLWQQKQLARWVRQDGTWAEAAPVDLPVRPRQIVPGPSSTGGLVIAGDRRVVLVDLPGPDEQVAHVSTLYLAAGRVILSAAGGHLAVLDQPREQVLFYS